jgi:hypothetical protein
MSIAIRDTSGNIWAITATSNGQLSTSLASGSPQPIVLFLKDQSSHIWQVGVNTLGELTTVPGVLSDTPQFTAISLGSTPNYNLFINTLGMLQTGKGGVSGAWVPNGFGAGADNSVVGGGGGFMAYPQPPMGLNAAFNPPENNGQFGPLSQTVWNGTGNWFQLFNPGRSA